MNAYLILLAFFGPLLWTALTLAAVAIFFGAAPIAVGGKPELRRMAALAISGAYGLYAGAAAAGRSNKCNFKGRTRR